MRKTALLPRFTLSCPSPNPEERAHAALQDALVHGIEGLHVRSPLLPVHAHCHDLPSQLNTRGEKFRVGMPFTIARITPVAGQRKRLLPGQFGLLFLLVTMPAVEFRHRA